MSYRDAKGSTVDGGVPWWATGEGDGGAKLPNLHVMTGLEDGVSHWRVERCLVFEEA